MLFSLSFLLFANLLCVLLLLLVHSSCTLWSLVIFSIVRIVLLLGLKNILVADLVGFIQRLHLTGASFLFIAAYVHVVKGLVIKSHSILMWVSGWSLLVLIIATAFSRYLLPLSNISLWGSTVISNLLAVVPLLGPYLVHLISSSYFVGSPLLKLFLLLHM